MARVGALSIIGGLAVGAYLWKGRELRAVLSMTGAGWDKLHPEVKEKAAAVLSEANKVFKPQGLSVGIFEGWRSEARQREVMGTGNSEVSTWLNSYHPWGLAVDFVFLDKLGRWTWEPFSDVECEWYNPFCTDPNRAAWDSLGEIIKRHGFEWGGDWRKFDGPHAQLTRHGRTADLISFFGHPDKVAWT